MQEAKRLILEKTLWSEQKLSQEVAAKIKEFAGLLTEEGALEMIARENQVELPPKTRTANFQSWEETEAGREASFVARVKHVFPPKEFERGNRKGRVCNVLLENEKGATASLVLWNRDCALAEKFERGQEIEVENALVKNKNPLEFHATIATQLNARTGERKQAKKIGELREGEEADFFARVLDASEVKEFEKQNKKSGAKETGKVARLVLADDTGKIAAILWDENAETAKLLRAGDAVKIESALIKKGVSCLEAHLGWRARLMRNPQAHGLAEREALWETHFPPKKISELREGESASIQARIRELGGARFFRKCRKCGKNINLHETTCSCGSTDYRDVAMLEALLADESSEMRVIFFGREAAHFLGMNSITIDPQTVLELKKPSLTGKTTRIIVQAKKGLVSGKLEGVCKHVVSAPS
ncbi:MAG: hypothetical protein ACP5O3_03950 [Candidatus Micrarchaeia archaeon]